MIMMIWFLLDAASDIEYCRTQEFYGHACELPIDWWMWPVGILGWIVIFGGLFGIFAWGVTNTFKMYGSYGYKSDAYKQQFSRVRKDILARDGYRCVMCGSTTNLHVHHRVGRAMGGSNSGSNLVTLCKYHHGMMHGKNWR